MRTAKKQVLEALKDLPEEVDLTEVIERLYQLRRIQQGLHRGDDSRMPSDLPRKSYQISPVSLGSPRLPSLDNIAEVLALAEGEDHR